MELLKIVGIGFITLILTIFLKEYKKDFVIYVILIGGAFIIFLSIDSLKNIVNFLNDISSKFQIDDAFVNVLLKITGISILSEFATSICKDCGESAIASKIDLGGKIIVISLSIPVIGSSLEQLLSLLPA